MSFDLDMDGGYENGRSTPPKRSGRHVFTSEDRRRGATATNLRLKLEPQRRHKFTRDQCASGAYMVAALVLFNLAKRHVLSTEDRRRGGLAAAAKRRAQRERDLIGLALRNNEARPSPQQIKRLEEIYLGGSERVELVMAEVAKMEAAKPVVDAFTLSALKRFRLGPLSPLSLTRSQRAQVGIMVEAGYLEVSGDSFYQLTSKGREAIA